MFNVTILKMKDILKYFIGIVLTGLIVFFVSKGVSESSENNSNNIIQKLKSGMSFLSQDSMLYALDQTIPVISNVNQEYKNIAKEDDENEGEDILQLMLGTQITSIKAMEDIQESRTGEEMEENKQEETNETIENKAVAEAGVTTEIITPNPISDGSNTKIRKCKNKK